MSTPLGPRLIGEAEKTLNALLCRFLAGTGLTEPEWVTLRLADLLDGSVDADGLTAAAADRAHFANAAPLVGDLTKRGLLDDGRLTSAGRELTTAIQATIITKTAPIWDNLPADDVAAATRVLQRGRHPSPGDPGLTTSPISKLSEDDRMTSDAVAPFHLAIPDDDLEDLRSRLRATRWPEPATDSTQGIALEELQHSAPIGPMATTGGGLRSG